MHAEDRSSHYEKEKVIEVKSGVRSRISFLKIASGTSPVWRFLKKEMDV